MPQEICSTLTLVFPFDHIISTMKYRTQSKEAIITVQNAPNTPVYHPFNHSISLRPPIPVLAPARSIPATESPIAHSIRKFVS
jgi:hypothetical protein